MASSTKQNIPGLTLQQLLRGTPTPVRQRGMGKCRLLARQYGPGSRQGFQRSRPQHPTWYNEMRTVTACDNGRRYSYIRFYGPPKPTSPTWVWCSCPHFAYNVEWVLAQYGSSTVSPGLENRGVTITNEPPRIRNPKQIPYLCKHLIMAAGEALKQTRDYAMEEVTKEQQKTAQLLPVKAAVPRQVPLAQQTIPIIPQRAPVAPQQPAQVGVLGAPAPIGSVPAQPATQSVPAAPAQPSATTAPAVAPATVAPAVGR